MAGELVISTGMPDTQMYLQAVANVDAPFSVTPQSGNYPLVGNILVNRKLASRWIAVNLASRAFVDGLGVTSCGIGKRRFYPLPASVPSPALEENAREQALPRRSGAERYARQQRTVQ